MPLAPAEAPNIWREDYTVRSYEVDAEGRLSILSLFNILQDSASNHADALGVSVHHLMAEDKTWVLSRMRLVIESYPRWRDRVRVHTWPSGGNRLFAFRKFAIEDARGKNLGMASSAWLVIDIAKRRPVRIAPFLQRLRPQDTHDGLPDAVDKLPAPASARLARRFRVRYRDLDINQHVNNVSYIEWALESIPREQVAGAHLVDLEINFLSEAFLDDRIEARWQPVAAGGNRFLHSLKREASGRELVRVQTMWASPP